MRRAEVPKFDELFDPDPVRKSFEGRLQRKSRNTSIIPATAPCIPVIPAQAGIQQQFKYVFVSID